MALGVMPGARDRSEHRLRIEGEGEASLALHPWNHAPASCLSLRLRRCMSGGRSPASAARAHLNALTGAQLERPCIAIQVSMQPAGSSEQAAGSKPRNINNVHGLSSWLHGLYSVSSGALAGGLDGTARRSTAAGKTTLISQMVMLALETGTLAVIKVQQLQARMRDAPEAFSSS